MSRAAIYTRISTDEKNQPWSIGAQRQSLEEFCKKEGHEIVAIYEDTASAATAQRPGLIEALQDAKLGRFDILVFYRVDRLSRSILDTVQIVKELDESDVKLQSATEPFETATPQGRFFMQMLAVFAELERAIIQDRIREGVQRRALSGKWSGSLPIGLVEDESGKPVADPANLPIAKRIFDLYVNEGRGSTSIAKQLNAENAVTVKGNRWTPQAVLQVLKSSAYVSQVRWGGVTVPGEWDPVIDEKVWDRAQEIREGGALKAAQRGGKRAVFLLTGLMRCTQCGDAYVGCSGRGRLNRKYRYYSCNGRKKKGKTYCAAPNVPADLLESKVEDQLIAVFQDQPMIDRIWARVYELQQMERADEAQNESSQLRSELRKVEDAQQRYFEAFEEGGLEPQLLSYRLKDLSAKRSAVEIRLAEIESRASDLPEKAPSGTIDLIRKALAADRSQEPGRLRDLLQLLIGKIEVGEFSVEFTVRVPGSSDEVRLSDGQVETVGIEPTSAVA